MASIQKQYQGGGEYKAQAGGNACLRQSHPFGVSGSTVSLYLCRLQQEAFALRKRRKLNFMRRERYFVQQPFAVLQHYHGTRVDVSGNFLVLGVRVEAIEIQMPSIAGYFLPQDAFGAGCARAGPANAMLSSNMQVRLKNFIA